MGRLRNLSASFKAAAFSHSREPSEPQPSFTKVNSRQSNPSPTDFNDRERPPAVRDASSSSLPQSGTPTNQLSRAGSRPVSMMYTPPSIDTARDMQIDELLPVFSFLSSHGNKLYQEGYFLKLNDLDTQGKPNADRNWTECFAQLVGTVLSLWDAAALDAAGQDGEVAPTFVNLADASIKMIETLPTRNAEVQPLQNVLSISTAGKNRYLLHFNSLHSLTQWTAGIRLAMFEHASLHEVYTGSLIAGKGKHLNNIRAIMERTKFRHEDWARVRFGAGTPWRRCWCVIEPPDEKEWQRATKTMKKRSAYERPAYPKGDIKFYDTKKTKKVTPIATITDAYSAYAIYPQSKPLIDQSTLVKVEGKITIHSQPESKTEGFVFVMPELHPAVSGFEMMLRWLFPVYDCFHLYGRPNRLIADTLDAKGLMFAMPKEKRYGYLDIIDVAALIHTDGSNKWSEREWRKQLKDMTARRMMSAQDGPTRDTESRRGHRNSMGSRNGVHYEDGASIRSTPSRGGHQHNMSTDAVFATQRKVTAPAALGALSVAPQSYHNRSASESVMSSPSKGRRQNNGYVPSRLSTDYVESPRDDMDISPVPSAHHRYPNMRPGQHGEAELIDSRNSSDSDLRIQRSRSHAEEVQQDMRQTTPPGAVAAPPSFQHQPNDKPQKRPEVRPEALRQKSRMSNATLDQMVQASKLNSNNAAGIAAVQAWRNGNGGQNENQPPQGVNNTSDNNGISANQAQKAVVAEDGAYTQSPAEFRPPERRQPSEHSITRKPVPRSDSQHSASRKPLPTAPTEPIPALPQRMKSDDSTAKCSDSNYDNDRANDSDESPDYASTRKSEETQKSIPRVRSGVLKTVGGTGAPPVPQKADIPEIDFGVTRALTPGPSRPSTAMGTVGNPFDTPDSTPERRARSPGDVTPENKLASYGRVSPRPTHSRGASYAWQPGANAERLSPGRSLSPEEFVQQRFAAANHPSGYVPNRSVSASRVEQIATAPKKLQKKREPRPDSRNSLLMNDYSSSLSAREREHVAKMTGGPLLNMQERSRTPDPSVGLIGAIEAREQEKRNIREGVSGHMVQAAIAQRQHHAQAQQVQAQQAAERAYAQQYSGHGQQYQQPQQQFTSWGMPIQQQQQPQYQQRYGDQPQYHQTQQQQQWQGQYGSQQYGSQSQPNLQQPQQQQYDQRKYGGFY